MSTRALYGFQDERGTHWVYVHHDGYPSGAAEKFTITLNSKLAWPRPRIEADEFAAAFISANKTSPGSVRLAHGHESFGDTEYSYEITLAGDQLQLRAWDNGHQYGMQFFHGKLVDFIANAEKIEKTLSERE